MKPASDNNNPLDLSALDFGPAWARGKDASKKPARRSRDGESRGADRNGRDRKFSESGSARGPKRDFKGGRRSDNRSGRPAPRQRVEAPEGVKASVMPVEEGIDNLVKEVTDSGRTYSVFDLARVILKSRERFNISFSVEKESELSFFQSKADQATFLTKAEALVHFAASPVNAELYTEEQIEVEAPTGNFPSIACCGFTGNVIAPPNFHGYQAKVQEIYDGEFTNMSLDRYKQRIEIVKDEAKVAEWLESMKTKTQYKSVKQEGVVLGSKGDMVNHFSTHHFDELYVTSKRVFVPSQVSFKLLAPGLATSLLECISEQVRYPGDLSSFLCRQLSGRHLAVYKWQGKLHAGPSRPHVVPAETPIADRPQAIMTWVTENSGKGVDQLWASVLPADVTEESKLEWFHDLHWVLNQGFLVLLENGNLHLSADSKLKPSKGKKSGKKPSAKAKPVKENKAAEVAEKSPSAEVKEQPKEAPEQKEEQ